MKTKLFTLLSLSFISTFSAAYAASANQTLTLSGAIADSVSISVTPSASASNLTLTSSASDVSVATVSESSNSPAGYIVLAKSSNAGKLVHSSDSSQSIAYTVKYASGSALSLTSVDQTVKTQSSGGLYSSVSSGLSISFTGVAAASKLAGTYSDVITLTVQGQ